MRGLTVSLRVRTLAGTDSSGGPVWTDTFETVDNVLIGEPGAEGISDDAGIYGRRQVFLLGIPKGDVHNWMNRHVSWTGPQGTVYGITFGFPITGVERLIPTPWHMKVRCVRIDPSEEKTATLWSAGKRVALYGVWMSPENGIERTETGKVGDDTVALALPETVLAYSEGALLTYCGPKAYAAMSAADQAVHYTIDSNAFFALGDVRATGKFQEINAAYDDVYRVQSVKRKQTGTDTEYLEVTGK